MSVIAEDGTNAGVSGEGFFSLGSTDDDGGEVDGDGEGDMEVDAKDVEDEKDSSEYGYVTKGKAMLAILFREPKG